MLASASPRRREILGGLGVEFEVRPADIDESSLPGETAAGQVERLALGKARAAARDRELVLGADTIVVLDGETLGKPAHEDDARAMLRRLSGRQHAVLSGIALYEQAQDRATSSVEQTAVTFSAISATEIDWYVATGEPLDKAGAYAVQGLAALFVERLEGSYSNVVGLPLGAIYRLFAELGYDLRDWIGNRPGSR